MPTTVPNRNCSCWSSVDASWFWWIWPHAFHDLCYLLASVFANEPYFSHLTRIEKCQDFIRIVKLGTIDSDSLTHRLWCSQSWYSMGQIKYSNSPIGHLVKVFSESGEIWWAFLALFLGPYQHFRDFDLLEELCVEQRHLLGNVGGF